LIKKGARVNSERIADPFSIAQISEELILGVKLEKFI
jgi:hypothetical protein